MRWCYGLVIIVLVACSSGGKLLGEACQRDQECRSGNCGQNGGSLVCVKRDFDEKLCVPGETQTCVCGNGDKGSQFCRSDGKSWEECACEKKIHCAPGSTQACACLDGKGGKQLCNTDGQSWGACQCSDVCTPGATQTCTCPDGKSGSQTCNADGQSWATCTCQSTSACTPGATQSCVCTDGKSGSQNCQSDGMGWEACQCQSGPICTAGATQTCTCADGKSGSQTCKADGTAWEACQCQTTCTPGATQTCTCVDGKSGSQTCKADGMGWEACQCKAPKALGDPCNANSDCLSSFCLQTTGGPSYCSQTCTNACPAGFTCALQNAQQVCGKIPPNGGDLGAACTQAQECKSLICLQDGKCSQRCEASTCPNGYECLPSSGIKLCLESKGRCKQSELQNARNCLGQCSGNSICEGKCFDTHLSKDCYACYSQLAACGIQNSCTPGSQAPNCCSSKRIECFGS